MPPYETPEEAARRKHRAMAGRGITAYNARELQKRIDRANEAKRKWGIAEDPLNGFGKPEEERRLWVRAILRRAGITGMRRP